MAAAAPLATHRPLARKPSTQFWSFAVPIACLVLAHLPFLIPHAEFLWLRSHYEFFPIVLIGAGILGVSRFRQSGVLEPGRRGVALWLVGLSWILLASGAALFSPWLGAIGGLVTLLAVIYGIGGRPLLALLLPAWVFLCLLIPPPLGYDNDLILWLQRAVSRVNSHALDCLGIRYFMDGNLVIVAGRALMIGKSCSGILSLLPVLSCTLFYVLWNRLSVPHAIALFVTAAFWDFVGNVARVLAVVVLFTNWGVDASLGWAHEALGIFVFLITLGLIASTDFLLKFVEAMLAAWQSPIIGWYRYLKRRWHWNPLAPTYMEDDPYDRSLSDSGLQADAKPPSAAAPLGTPTLPALSRTWLSSWLVIAVYCGLGVAGATALAPLSVDSFRVPPFVKLFNSFDEKTLPAHSGAFVREAFEPVRRDYVDTRAKYSRAWYYRWNDRTVAIAVDYPFRGWHGLTDCYENDGWLLDETSIQRGATAGVSRATFSRPDGRLGFLLFSSFDERGNPLGRSPLFDSPTNFGSRLKGKMVHPSFRDLLRPSFQVQLFTESEAALSPGQDAEARAFFEEIRRLVQQKVASANSH